MKTSRTTLVALLIVALLAAGGAQINVQQQRQKLTRSSGSQSGTSLANMNSYALALLLGGLRGPLVMVLWQQSETQKSAKQLEGLDTQIEWIRLLQPEFDTVHLFQIWNKAYNISVQLASLPNKYSTILDAIEYARSVDRERPDNLNMLAIIGQTFNDKLGGSQEKGYYRRRVREDSMRQLPAGKTLTELKRSAMEPLLDPAGNILPQYLAPRFSTPLSDPKKPGFTYDGSELQFLKTYQPYPYGVSPLAIGYNYYQRSLSLQEITGQHHIQLSAMVLDTRPALALEQWGMEEWERARRIEITMLGRQIPIERVDMEVAAADVLPGRDLVQAKAKEVDEIVYSLGMTARLFKDSVTEFQRHLANPEYASNQYRYQWHLDHMTASGIYVQADRDALLSVRSEGAKRDELLASARKGYQQAWRLYNLIRLRYYVMDQMADGLFPKGIDRTTVEKLTDDQITAAIVLLEARVKAQGWDMHQDDTTEYQRYTQRCLARLKIIK